MLDNRRVRQHIAEERRRPRTPFLLKAAALAWGTGLLLAGPAHASGGDLLASLRPAVSAQPAAPAPEQPPANPATPETAPGPPAPAPQMDTQPPGVSAYLPAEALITILVIIAVFTLSLRFGPALAKTGIEGLLRLLRNTPPAP
ncbi:hypothetical protein [Streptomyces sp. NPDC007883]|uniref:hypothetical protein n=1 Tax=Streptomyces sp. NPDC007883 TaxID=3155116 RepID=UPI0034044127